LGRRQRGLAAEDARFRQQARWTADLRAYLRDRFDLTAAAPTRRTLEIGCGTGVLLPELHAWGGALIGLDRDRARLTYAQAHAAAPDRALVAGDALRLPFAPASFDLAVAHFVLLWLADPAAALAELRRVVRPGGRLLCLAEPDHAARIDYPPELAELGACQTAALARRGADPQMGRQLGARLHAAGLTAVETGLLGGQWSAPPAPPDADLEWATLAADLAATVTPATLAAWRDRDRRAWQSGARLLFVPVFWGTGIVPP
jgi:ubiquinone/menaquinone biosynthesis C-methylase UbiE